MRNCAENCNAWGERVTGVQSPPIPVRGSPHAFFPTHFMTQKITFRGIEDPEAHITTLHTQMMISGGTDAMHCKLFMATFLGTTLDWFISLPDGHITSFDQFSTLFRE